LLDLKRSRTSKDDLQGLIKYFSFDLDAHKIAYLNGLNCNTLIRYLLTKKWQIFMLICGTSGTLLEFELNEGQSNNVNFTGHVKLRNNPT